MSKILVVDDSSIMRRNLKGVLKETGHTVVAEAANGLEAYDEYKISEPDLVTMDITMPKMNGIEAVEKIIGEFPEAKIIVISALDQKNMIFRALQAGAMHYILKPITIEKVVKIIDEVLLLSNENIVEEVSSS